MTKLVVDGKEPEIERCIDQYTANPRPDPIAVAAE